MLQVEASAGGYMLSQSIRAETCATVGSAKKRESLTSRYRIRPDHVLFLRDVAFESGIMKVTR